MSEKKKKVREEGLYLIKRVAKLPKNGNANILYAIKSDRITELHRGLPSGEYETINIGSAGGSGVSDGYIDGVTLEGDQLVFTSQGNGFEGSVNLSSISGGGDLADTVFAPYLTLQSTNGQAAIEELKDELDAAVMTAGMVNPTENTFPLKGATGFVDSSLRETDTEIVAAKSIRVPTGSIDLDDSQTISGNSRTIEILDKSRNRRSVAITSEYSLSGSEIPKYYENSALMAFMVQPNEGAVSGDFSFSAPVVDTPGRDGIKFVEIIITPDEIGSGRFSMKYEDINGETIQSFSDFTVEANQVGVDKTLVLTNALDLYDGENIYIDYLGSNLRGILVSGNFIPKVQTMSYPFVIKNLATEEYVTTLIHPNTGPQGMLSNLKIDGQSTGVNTGFTLSGGQVFTFNVNNPSLFTGNLTLKQGNTVLSNSISPTINMEEIMVTTETLNAIGESITFTLEGTNTNGTLQTTSFVIHVVGSGELVYYGTSPTGTEATIDLSTLESRIVGNGNLEIETGTVANGDYFILLVPTDHDVHSIVDDVLQQNVTSIFVRTADVRTINSISYNSYVIGPLNADTDGETYTINLL